MNTNQFRTKIREVTNTSSNDYPDASLIRDLNSELTMIQIGILRDRGVLEFDDVNFSDLPYATFTIKAGTRSYKILEDDNQADILTIHKVGVLTEGTFDDVPRIQLAEGSERALTMDSDDTAVVPSAYFEAGSSIVFKETPEQNTQGKAWFDRELSFLKTSDTTKVPGVPSAYHNLAAYRTAYNYAIDKGLPNEAAILRRIKLEEERLQTFEETRRGDEATIMSPVTVSGL